MTIYYKETCQKAMGPASDKGRATTSLLTLPAFSQLHLKISELALMNGYGSVPLQFNSSPTMSVTGQVPSGTSHQLPLL